MQFSPIEHIENFIKVGTNNFLLFFPLKQIKK